MIKLPQGVVRVDLKYAKYEDDRPCWRLVLYPGGELFVRQVLFRVTTQTVVVGNGGNRRGWVQAEGRVRWEGPEQALVLVVE